MEAMLATFDIMLRFGRDLVKPEVLGTIFVGGALGGILAEWTNRRWS
jgi:hypothetical protein